MFCAAFNFFFLIFRMFNIVSIERLHSHGQQPLMQMYRIKKVTFQTIIIFQLFGHILPVWLGVDRPPYSVIRELKKTSTTTATATSLNKRF